MLAISVNRTIYAVVPLDPAKVGVHEFSAVLPERAYPEGMENLRFFLVREGPEGVELLTSATPHFLFKVPPAGPTFRWQ